MLNGSFNTPPPFQTQHIPTDMSANTSEAGPSTTATANGTTAEARPLEQLGALEEDDEFEVSLD